MVTSVPTQIRATGLTNGTTYYFSVSATNIIGTGSATNYANCFVTLPVPATAPSVPTNITASENTTQTVTVSFSPPVSDGGAPITSYRVVLGGNSYSGTSTLRSASFSGLTKGSSYNYTVSATNSVGTTTSGTQTIRVRSVPESTVTGVQRDGGTSGNYAVKISFRVDWDGGSTITQYKVTDSAGGTATGTGSPIRLTGQRFGVSTSYSAVLTNASGVGYSAYYAFTY